MACQMARSPCADAKVAQASSLGVDRPETGVRPAKLFIGGITRHTTTKQLRDHFSRYGRVLDCVAMRQPDGRPRGFGYVTLDSPTAADRCLAEPQVIDGRVVDMKRAVPEGAGTGGNSPAQHADIRMGMRTAHSPFCGWPESPGSFFPGTHMGGCSDANSHLADPLWSWGPTSMQKGSGEVLDCVELLSRRAHGLQAPAPGGESLLGRTAQSTVGTLSASAPEFVPSSQAQEPVVVLNVISPVSDGPRRTPLGELTNITNIMNNKGGKDTIKVVQQGERRKPTPLATLRVDGASKPGVFAGSENGFAPSIGAKLVPFQDNCDDSEMQQESPASKSDDSEEGSRSGGENTDEETPAAALSEHQLSGPPSGPLPSVGSADHFRGTCKRCNFFPKGRCQNGADCTFCHYPHDKRKPSRQEKRDRRALHVGQRDGVEGLTLEEDITAALLLGEENQDDSGDEEDANQRTLAYTMLPGMPPVGSVKLPAPLLLPGNGSYSTTPGFPCLPPGLPHPKGGLEMWQPDDDQVSPISYSGAATQPAPVLATVPMGPTTPQSVAASPTAASAASQEPSAEPCALLAAVPVKETCSIGTQTAEDLDHTACTRCCHQVHNGGADIGSVVPQASSVAAADSQPMPIVAKPFQIFTWQREELLRIRGAMEASGALPARGVARATGRT